MPSRPPSAAAAPERPAPIRSGSPSSGVAGGDRLPPAALGCEWVVEARGCDPAALADLDALRGLFRRMVDELALNEVRPAQWHVFPGPGGVTGMSLLAESHLTCHTFPEHGTLCLNLFCCTPRPEWDFGGGLREAVGAAEVEVRRLDRRYGPRSAAGGDAR